MPLDAAPEPPVAGNAEQSASARSFAMRGGSAVASLSRRRVSFGVAPIIERWGCAVALTRSFARNVYYVTIKLTHRFTFGEKG